MLRFLRFLIVYPLLGLVAILFLVGIVERITSFRGLLTVFSYFLVYGYPIYVPIIVLVALKKWLDKKPKA
ncbi:hypothetical protein [Hymenobacter sediminis]|uniref:hypothetical protein n=1 Tax=Hymenobacter sediminis TaxID=2218621 RepID=UPI000DA6A310|nr:hypothetical protein [Hymenobacter sediminis]